ncbi:MAG: UDP-N-acetylglucosamine 1-carboxyvinyltransferase [Eubacterium sp.]|nr:UDP-N-acetylglucosamine 1-carboxyvinyltransferase [Eubacterium sp.]
MEIFKINGQKSLSGDVTLHGAKNSALPILCASLLVKGESIIHNCPDLSDVKTTLKILEDLGCKVKRNGDTVIIDASEVTASQIDEGVMRTMRSSILFLGALVSRTGCASIYLPGGCDIGTRPVDMHIRALKSLGATITENGSSITCCADRLTGAKIILPFASVGATENIIIAAAVSKGKTTIINPAREPEICDLAEFLNKCGARIYGAGETSIEIEGVDKLIPCEHRIIPDRILASTYMSACAVTGGDIVIHDVKPTHLSPVFPVFNEMGCRLYLNRDELRIVAPKRLRRVKMIKTMPFPAFPTDSQSPVTAALTMAKGTSVIKENIFENRFRFVGQLNRFGADIAVDEQMAVINGVKLLHGADVYATDLRGGAALVIAGIAAEGETTVRSIEHIDRGYAGLENNFKQLGADIKRIEDEEISKEKDKKSIKAD